MAAGVPGVRGGRCGRGAGVFAVAAVDSVVSWSSDRVLLSDPALARLAGAVLLPSWLWMIASFLMVFGVPRRDDSSLFPPARLWPRLRVRGRIGMAAAVVVCAAVIAGGFAVGAAKGSARVLPGPRYEVSTLDLSQAQWTHVTAAQHHMWQARYVREDGALSGFGLMLAWASLGFLRLRRTAAARIGQGLPPLGIPADGDLGRACRAGGKPAA